MKSLLHELISSNVNEKVMMPTIELLIKNGANINAQNYDRKTPLHYAALIRHTEVVELLIKNGAKINVQNNCGSTHRDRAARNWHKEIVELLKQYGAVA